MKKQILISGVALATLFNSGCSNAQKSGKIDDTVLKNQVDSVSYAIGVSIGESFKQDNFEALNMDLVAAAMKKAAAKDSMKMNAQSANQCIQQYMMGIERQKAEKNMAEGQKFLDDNKKKPGVITTASGLQYQVITAGTGPKPADTNRVSVKYRGTLLNGFEFDNSEKSGGPVTFGCKQVIPGWTEALQLMPVGSKWKLFIPGNIAYGDRGGPRGSGIGPNQTLIFDIELLSIEK